MIEQECKFCDDHRRIQMEKPPGAQKWTVMNLDGSRHVHFRQGQPSRAKLVQEITEEAGELHMEQPGKPSQREEIKAMAEAKNEIAKDTNKALLALAEAIKELADALKGGGKPVP